MVRRYIGRYLSRMRIKSDREVTRSGLQLQVIRCSGRSGSCSAVQLDFKCSKNKFFGNCHRRTTCMFPKSSSEREGRFGMENRRFRWASREKNGQEKGVPV